MFVIEPLRRMTDRATYGHVFLRIKHHGDATHRLHFRKIASFEIEQFVRIAWSPAIEMQVNARNAPFTFIAVRP